MGDRTVSKRRSNLHSSPGTTQNASGTAVRFCTA